MQLAKQMYSNMIWTYASAGRSLHAACFWCRVLWEDADTGMMEPYAVKVLTPPEPEPSPSPLYRRQLAQHEQEVLAEIRLLEVVRGLPHVVQLADHFKAADGTYYIVMECVSSG